MGRDMKTGLKETDLGRSIVSYLRDMGWEVYQEVQGPGGRADIVATQGKIVRVVECKMSFSAALIEQAWSWQPWVHYVHVAVPCKHTVAGHRVLKAFCKSIGIGTLEIMTRWTDEPNKILEGLPGRLNRKAITNRVLPLLMEQQKTWAEAGNAENKFWSPWKETCKAWTEYVVAHPGCTLKELVKYGHHYSSDSSARSNMAEHIRLGRVPGIEIRYEGRMINLYPAETGQNKE